MNNISNIEFEFLFFLLIPILFLLCDKYCKYKPAQLYFPHIDIMSSSKKINDVLVGILKWLVIISASIALASPIFVNKEVLKSRIGYDIVTALDASGSMEYPFLNDRSINKFDVTKRVIQTFIKKRETDNLAAVAFGRYAFIISPLSYDKKALSVMVDQVQMHPSFSNGTAIGDAIAQSVRVLKSSKAKNRIIILATDGEEEGDVTIPYDKATALAKKHDIKIYTIGIGQNGQFNASALRYIASETNGEFFLASDKKALNKVYEKIDELEKSEITSSDFVKKDYLYGYPLFVAIISLLFYLYFKYRERK